ncbi:MAG: tetratricopeptide repeat protein [Melioribacteraceae bacterium]|nr:tetratricopeptide repeat protein [Melioribacteraceae bacterium]
MKKAVKTILTTILFCSTLLSQNDSLITFYKALLLDRKYVEIIELIKSSENQRILSPEENKFMGLALQGLFNYRGAEKYFEASRRLSGYNPEINYLLGKAAYVNNNKDSAINYFSEILENDPLNILASVELANSFLETQNYQKAGDLFGKILLNDSTNTFILRRHAYCKWKLGELGEAVKNYNDVLRHDPSDATSALQLSKIYYDTEQYEYAGSVLDTALLFNKNNPGLHKLAAETLFKQGKYESAVIHYLKSLALGDSSAGVYQKLGFSYYFIAQSDVMYNTEVFKFKINEAVKALKRSYELDDQNPLTTLYLGICYKEIEYYDKAEDYLLCTIEIIIPDYMSSVYTHLGAVNEYQMNFEDAIKNYLTAYSYDKNNKTSLFYIASAMDRFYADRKTPLLYYSKFLRENEIDNPVLAKFAKERIDKLTEEMHFNGQSQNK